ncbi:MAG: hypothetical protein H0U31_02100 [Chloroflexia bacterium]|nr:hypothetical protein [Chloroflexia bacterium]
MHQGRFFTVNRSRFVLRPALRAGKRALADHSRSRLHRWLISFAFLIAVVGSSSSAAAAPPIVEAHDTGGAFTSESSLGFAADPLFTINGSFAAPEVCPPCREP